MGIINMPGHPLPVWTKTVPRAVRVAMEAGASGFPGGTRGLVISAIGLPDTERCWP
ncbi:hypothetical protein KCP78_20315 [Salmonella enterica subsp. enterica]|nr:hypothetical protein KCP78_20315 [Salmonella enterica subsp. enterica]